MGSVSADVAVVGGGLVGLATAYHAVRRGARVVVLDKGAVGGEQSGRAWGFVRRHGRPAPVMGLMADAGPVWEELSTELGADLEFVRAGNLAVAETAADAARLEEGHRAARAAGVASRLLTGGEVRALVPGLQGRWTAGLLGDEDGHAEPRAVVTAFARAAPTCGSTASPSASTPATARCARSRPSAVVCGRPRS